MLENFRSDASVNVLLMTMQTGGVGLDLSYASRVFLFDIWWNKAIEEQAIARVHRIGQVIFIKSRSKKKGNVGFIFF